MIKNYRKPPIGDINQQKMIVLCQELIQLPSYTGNEQHVANKLKQVMCELGFDSAEIDSYGNVVGEIRGQSNGPKILFDGHMDTVAVANPNSWTVNPFGGIIHNNKIYGRGASDMKCALAAMVCGLAPLVKCKDRMKGSIYISGTVCEETFEGLGLEKVMQSVNPDYVIIGEASNLSVKRGQRGRAEIAVATFGKAAHSSNPAAGKNAVYMMNKIISAVKCITMPHDDFLGDGILELTDIISSPYPGASVVPDCCRATFDRRLLVGETEEAVLAPIHDIINRLQFEDPEFSATAEIVSASQITYTKAEMSGRRFFPAWVLPPQATLVSKAIAGLAAAGIKAEVTKYSFCTNGSYSAGIAQIPTIGFGPGREDGAHVVDEWMELDQVIDAAIGYQAIADSLIIEK